MSLYLTKATKQTKDGKRYSFLILKENRYDPASQSVGQRYIGYVGQEPTLTESKARSICAAKNLTLDQLRSVRGLEILPDDQAPSDGHRTKRKAAAASSEGKVERPSGPAPTAVVETAKRPSASKPPAPAVAPERDYTLVEAGELLGVDHYTVWNLAQAGKLDMDSEKQISGKSLVRFIEKREGRP